MSDITPITSQSAVHPILSGRQAPVEVEATSARGSDSVEFSKASQLLAQLDQLPDVRTDLVSRVKSEIANGTYETPDKLDKAIESLAQDLAH